MSFKSKTCLFCLKQRHILVEDKVTVQTLRKIYDLKVTSGGCRICTECHFNIGQIKQFKDSIDAASDIDVDSCFVCKSENTLTEPGVDRVVDYLRKQCTTIDFGSTDTVKACAICLYLLEISIKYEKLAKNYAKTHRFCKQFSTLRECNVALWKLDLDALTDVCGLDQQSGKKENRGVKRGRLSGGRDEQPAKRSKQEDGSVLPVMLTKLTPTMTPNRPGIKKSTAGSSTSTPKGKTSTSLGQKFFIKLPMPKLQGKNKKRTKHASQHSPIRGIPAKATTDDLNRIFSIDLRPLSIRIEHVDLSNYMNRTIAHDKATRQLRKPKKEEFIGLDEEDVVEFKHNTSIGSSVGKRKSILVTERIESPNSAKKKVKFSDSPSIKYVDKVSFSDTEDEDQEDNVDDDNEDDDDKDDADYEGCKKGKKKGPKASNKAQNGTSPSTPENGRSRRAAKPSPMIGKESEKKDEENPAEKQTDSSGHEKKKSAEKSEDKVIKDTPTNAEKSGKSETLPIEQENQQERVHLQNDAHTEDPEQPVLTNGSPDEDVQKAETSDTVDKAKESTSPDKETSSSDVDTAAPMDAEDSTSSPTNVDTASEEPMKTSDDNADSPDAEMKDADQPEDVEMSENKTPSPATEDVEMKDLNGGENEPIQESTAAESQDCSTNESSREAPETDFDTFDQEEAEMEQVKASLSDILGESISDSDHQESQLSQDDANVNSTDSVADEVSKTEQQQNQSEQENKKDNKEKMLDLEEEIKSVEDSKSTEEKNTTTKNEEEPAANTEEEKEEEKEKEADMAEQQEKEPHSSEQPAGESTSPEKKNQSFSSLDDVDDISDDDDILDQLDKNGEGGRSPDLPPLGEDSL